MTGPGISDVAARATLDRLSLVVWNAVDDLGVRDEIMAEMAEFLGFDVERFECGLCGRIGTADDGIDTDGDDCPDDECGGIVHWLREEPS